MRGWSRTDGSLGSTSRTRCNPTINGYMEGQITEKKRTGSYGEENEEMTGVEERYSEAYRKKAKMKGELDVLDEEAFGQNLDGGHEESHARLEDIQQELASEFHPDLSMLEHLPTVGQEAHAFLHEEVAQQITDPNQNLCIQSLPILDNLSSQILSILGKGPHQETLNIVTRPDTAKGQAYRTLTSLFNQVKKLYSTEAFLNPDLLDLRAPQHRATIRKVNLATFVSSVFGSVEVGFFHLNEHFLDTFVPDGARLLKSQSALFLNLKTQAYISAIDQGEKPKEEILDDLFPPNMDQILLQRRNGAKSLTPNESDFVARCKSRKNHLAKFPINENLSEKYVWQIFLRDVSEYITRNYESIVSQPIRRHRRVSSKMQGSAQGHSSDSVLQVALYRQNQDPGSSKSNHISHIQHIAQMQQIGHIQDLHDDTDEATAMALNGVDANLFTDSNLHLNLSPTADHALSTQQLYEQARQAARPSPSRRGKPAQRRPWTKEEEQALFAGLDQVKGPHWSQILTLYGAGGTISEALKDRNQVQLKDKARNLKLFFLKNQLEVPPYLRFVTGDLKRE
uniref:Telomeric repeat binding factor 1 n=1 Tax=Pneumocystis carinii TaxID=4754 RepID=B2Z8W7_PNECA|nr:telomeric repeat binding factor 1 [Pneumocystis carinii]ACC91882.1 telomeric repeat binding factor 1 [Pneumocystis carinii]